MNRYVENFKDFNKPLFTTTDGVEIYDGDKYYFVDGYFYINKSIARKNLWTSKRSFSTRQLTENYLLDRGKELKYSLEARREMEVGESDSESKFISVEERFPDENDGKYFLVNYAVDEVPYFVIREGKEFFSGPGMKKDDFKYWICIDSIIDEIDSYFLYIQDNFGVSSGSLKIIFLYKLNLYYDGISLKLNQKEEFLNYVNRLNKLLSRLFGSTIQFEVKNEDSWFKTRNSVEGFDEIITNPNFVYKVKMKFSLDRAAINKLVS